MYMAFICLSVYLPIWAQKNNKKTEKETAIWARYNAQCRRRPEICRKFAGNLHLVDGPSSAGARRSADIK
jgi:hypothetical protein